MDARSRMSLYEIGVVGSQIFDYLDKTEGELSPEAEVIFDKLLTEGPDKLEAAAAVVRQLDAYQDECKAEEQRLAARRKAFEANAEKLKQRMAFALDGAFGGKLKTAKVSLWMQQSADTVAVDATEDLDFHLLQQSHPEFVRTKHELDKIAIRAAYERGDELPAVIHIENNPGMRSIRMM